MLGVSTLPFSTICVMDFATDPTELYGFFFILLFEKSNKGYYRNALCALNLIFTFFFNLKEEFLHCSSHFTVGSSQTVRRYQRGHEKA